MIKFFRKIRQQLLTENKFNKYLLYAVGEILLVVIGILIALQVNNWNYQLNENKIEIALLQQLENDLTRSLSDVKYNINLIDKGIHSAEFLLSYMSTDQPYQDSLASHFASSFPWTRLSMNLGAYETIKSKGIEIISNVELRDEIVNTFESRLYFQRQLENIAQEYVENMRRLESVKFFKSSYLDFGLQGGYDLGKSVPKNYEILRNDEEFHYYLESYIGLMKALQNLGNRPMKKRIEELVDTIQKELNKE